LLGKKGYVVVVVCSQEDEHTSTCDGAGGSSRAAVPMNLEGCSVCAPHQQLLLFLFLFFHAATYGLRRP